ncbi:putative Na+/H+ antiporter [Fluviibacter phosphoraccumulans]|uniref:Membrane protein n=1 Tax=Fluviibacter phosphoraccumulans TaxID=1751046 RepID=A0A679IE46_9RHOO|nr:putative Na+/H+ antiporter [Fluviibacter phosphoraccumulans]BBU67761.1 membrane protein [Fluviibacter phosphoraccumulans]BBU70700.1 membrane protein [Fluviibacter phosphoraccumulans]BCA65945.1 membrane protein [Fluviibacter phosphoraccumulans]
MEQPSLIEVIATVIFGVALIHTFAASQFQHLAHTHPRHSGLFHLLGEVEVVFGVWAAILILVMAFVSRPEQAIAYLDSRNYAEPLLVFVLMVMAASRPLVEAARAINNSLARLLPLQPLTARFVVTMSFIPLMGSFITEPAAMTLAALLMRDQFLRHDLPERFKYAIIGVLFVNVSIGGTLTPFAAPPVLMVAAKWDWDIAFMISQIGWRALIAVIFNAIALTIIGRKALQAMPFTNESSENDPQKIPLSVTLIHASFLAAAVTFHHHPVVFMGLFLFFLGYTAAYPHYQSRLLLREALLVAFFLAGLVVLGGKQAWWLQELLAGMSPTVLYFSATALTAITDNAAITYLGSLVDGTDAAFKYALVTGAVTGGGLTVIANAPNPAGYALLKDCFAEKSISALGLFSAALLPTLVAVAVFWLIP